MALSEESPGKRSGAGNAPNTGDADADNERIVNLSDMTPQQLNQIKQQAELIMNKLTVSIEQLYEMKKEYVKAAQCVDDLKNRRPGTPVLAPLAEGIYAKGTMPVETEKDDGTNASSRLLVDIGTGYIVEFTPAQALDHFKKHITHVDEEVKKLQVIGQQKLEIRHAAMKRLATIAVSNMSMPSINDQTNGAGDSVHQTSGERLPSYAAKAASFPSSTNSSLS